MRHVGHINDNSHLAEYETITTDKVGCFQCVFYRCFGMCVPRPVGSPAHLCVLSRLETHTLHIGVNLLSLSVLVLF